MQRGYYGLALVHTLAHVVGSLVCAGVGFAVARRLLA